MTYLSFAFALATKREVAITTVIVMSPRLSFPVVALFTDRALPASFIFRSNGQNEIVVLGAKLELNEYQMSSI